MSSVPPHCVSCGAPQPGEYCGACGERRPDHRDLTLAGFLKTAAESLINVDSRLLASFRTLLRQPGRLTGTYVRGRRREFLSPIQVFLIANLLFFLAAGAGLPVISLTTPLDVHLNASYAPLIEPAFEGALARRNIQRGTERAELFRIRFDSVAEQHGRTMVIIFAPLFALALALLRFRRGEPAGQHLAFSLHYLAFCMLLFIAVTIGVMIGRGLAPGRFTSESPLIPIAALSAMAIYLYHAFQRGYGSGRAGALLQAVLVAVLFLPLLQLFRMLLFFVVLYSM
jgi:hypothetical protein